MQQTALFNQLKRHMVWLAVHWKVHWKCGFYITVRDLSKSCCTRVTANVSQSEQEWMQNHTKCLLYALITINVSPQIWVTVFVASMVTHTLSGRTADLQNFPVPTTAALAGSWQHFFRSFKKCTSSQRKQSKQGTFCKGDLSTAFVACDPCPNALIHSSRHRPNGTSTAGLSVISSADGLLWLSHAIKQHHNTLKQASPGTVLQACWHGTLALRSKTKRKTQSRAFFWHRANHKRA